MFGDISYVQSHREIKICWVRLITFVKQVMPVSFNFTTFPVAVQDMCGGVAGYVLEELELRLALQLWLRAWQNHYYVYAYIYIRS